MQNPVYQQEFYYSYDTFLCVISCFFGSFLGFFNKVYVTDLHIHTEQAVASDKLCL